MRDDSYQTAYDRHWARLAELLGPEEATAERQRMTVDERVDRLRKKLEQFRKRLPELRRWLAEAEAKSDHEYAKRLRRQIVHREQVIADYEASQAGR